MTARDLLCDLRARDIRLTVEGGQLAYDAPEGPMTEDVLVQLRQHKAALLALLRQAPAPKPAPAGPAGAAPQAPSVAPAHTSDLPAAAAAADLSARLAQAAAGVTAPLADGGILVPMQDACSCGCRVWVVKVTYRVCTACGKQDGERPVEMLGEAPP